MPHRDAIYDEINRSPAFSEAIARARAESAHGLAMQVLEIADAAGPHDNPQLVKNRCDQRRWLAGKYNALYSDKVAVTDKRLDLRAVGEDVARGESGMGG
jgi:hypothetical protein